MLDPRPDFGDQVVDLLVDGMKIAALGGLAHDTPKLVRTSDGFLALSADISLVRPDRCLVAVQQFVPDPAVVHLGN